MPCSGAGQSPFGRYSMISTIARPYSIIRSTSDSTITLPNIIICSGATVCRSTSGKSDSSTAPSTTPGMWPRPPSTTIASTMIDSFSVNDSGDTKPWNAENIAPATPPKVAPSENASSFTLRTLMPIAFAASLVLADRHPGAAEPRVLQADADDDRDDGQHEEQVVVQVDRRQLDAEERLRSSRG